MIPARIVNLPEHGLDFWYVYCDRGGCRRRLGGLWQGALGWEFVAHGQRWRVADGMLELATSRRAGRVPMTGFGPLPYPIRCPDCGTVQVIDPALRAAP